MVETARTGTSSEPDPLQYTGLFMSGLKAGVPWDELLTMQLPRLVMMIDSLHPARSGKGGGEGGTRDATQADIDAFLT